VVQEFGRLDCGTGLTIVRVLYILIWVYFTRLREWGESIMKGITTRELVTMALLTGLVAVATMVIQVPSVATDGFVNFGDTFIFVSAIIFGPLAGFLAGGIGSALADVLTGYGHWAPFTLVIKALEGLICGYLYLSLSRRGSYELAAAGVGMVTAGTWMVVAYFFAGAILKGSLAVSALSIPGNIVQGVVSVAVALILLKPIRKIVGR
jgi:uncharacterized membrane protein